MSSAPRRPPLAAVHGPVVDLALERLGVTGPAWEDALRDIRGRFRAAGDARGVLTVDLALPAVGEPPADLLAAVPPVDRAIALLRAAEQAAGPTSAALLRRAADAYETAGLVAHAAILLERAGHPERARVHWSRLAARLAAGAEEPDGDPYPAGLARFNVARTSRALGDEATVREATTFAVHHLEAAADRYETSGVRERAFDCFQVLRAIGREVGPFEHVLEGVVNVIRILREDGLRPYALETYEQAIAAAEEHGELAAAATLAREFAAYARAEGFAPVGQFAVLEQARLWEEVAARDEARGGASARIENALHAAALAYAEVGAYGRIASLYERIGAISADPRRREHYRTAAARYRGAPEPVADGARLAPHLRQAVGFPDVWHVDLEARERGGEPALLCAAPMLDAARSHAVRRRAFVCRLIALEIEARGGLHGRDPELEGLLGALAQRLSGVEVYAVLPLLEALLQRPEVSVRQAVVRALGRFAFKRSFVALRTAIADPDPAVVAEACRSVEALSFPHAFDPLQRIHRDAANPAARRAALRAIARIDTSEAADLLLRVLDHGSADERSLLVEILRRAEAPHFVEAARRALRTLGPAGEAAVRSVLEPRLAPRTRGGK